MKISGKRLRRAGGVGPEVWVGRVALGAVALGAAWLAWNGVRPLPGPGTGEAAAPTPIAPFRPADTDIEQRAALLARVGGTNRFSPDWVPWSDRVVVEDTGAGEEDGGEAGGGGASTTVTGGEPADEPPTRVGAIRITPEDKLSDDIKKARDGLRLRGIRSTLDGGYAAMIALESQENGKFARVYRPGDEFVDEKFKKASWRVVAVDPALDLVVLNRSGSNVVVPLFDQSDEARARLIASGVPTGVSQNSATIAPTLERQSEAEIAAAMRAAGFEGDEIEALLARARGEAPGSATPVAETPAKPADKPASAKPPEGADDIFKILFSGGTPPMDAHLPNPEAEQPDGTEEPAPEPEPE